MSLPSDKDVANTVGYVYRNIKLDENNVPNFSGVVDAFDFVRRVPYVSKLSAQQNKYVQRATDTLKNGGQCDDKVVLSGVAMQRLGIPYRIVTTSYNPDGVMQHTYLEIFHGNKWQPFDATYQSNTIFSEKPYTRKLIWANPMNTYKGLGDSNKQETGTPGIIGEGWTMISNFFSSLFSGSSEHVDIATAQQMWHDEVTIPLTKFYNNLTQAGRNKLEELAKYNLENELAHWGNMWGAIGNNEYRRVKTLAEWNDQRWRIDWMLAFPFYALRISTHVGSDDNFWLTAASNGVRSYVWEPFKAYVSANPSALGVNKSTDINDPNNPDNSSGLQSAGMGVLPALLLGGVAIGVLVKMFLNSPKKRARR